MLRLVLYAPDGVKRFPVEEGELVVGSRPECDIWLPYAGVAQQHARLSFDGARLRIEDLGSRKGLLVSGKKVREAALEVLDEVRLGGVTLLVEDLVPGFEVPSRAAPRRPGPPTVTPERMVEHLCRASDWVLSDAESRTTSEALVNDVLYDFGGGALFLLLSGDGGDEAGLKLAAATDPAWLPCGESLLDQLRARGDRGDRGERGERGDHCDQPAAGADELVGDLAGTPAWISVHRFVASGRSYTLITALPSFRPGDWSPKPALKALGYLLVLGLVHHVGWYEPILPGHPELQDLTLDSNLVVGESAAMRFVLEQLRAAIDPPVHLLLCGEPGVGKELLARSLHLSGPRRNGPFIAVTCGGARTVQLEADLFGAVVPGRGAPVRREGKLLLADRGTLFLDEVDQLPAEIQARLVRFLRSGEVEPAGSGEHQKVDVRLVVGSRVPLESLVARELFRVDLAYRLSRLTIEVPSLRERREDLPLLIQSYINRFCHETGRRMQGITVKAMSALLSYDYPGNLAELENIARQLVYLAPVGRPADVNLLPERVRNGNFLTPARLDAGSDLDLERLVSGTEQLAIREALRRTHGNKTQAARLLGLSRNGLAIKMERYGLKG